MASVLLALFLFFASVLTHVFFCRMKPKAGLQARAFIIISFLFWTVYMALVWKTQLLFKVTAGLIFILLVPIYMCFYVLTQLTSPSKKILASIASRGGLSYADMVACVEQEDFIGSRLKDLEISGCVARADGRYRLSLSGWKIAGVLDRMQLVLGRDIGG